MMMTSLKSDPYAGANKWLQGNLDQTKDNQRKEARGGQKEKPAEGKDAEAKDRLSNFGDMRATNLDLLTDATTIRTEAKEHVKEQTEQTATASQQSNQLVQSMDLLSSQGLAQVQMQNPAQGLDKGLQIDFGLSDPSNPEGQELKQNMTDALGPMAMEIMGTQGNTGDQLKALAKGIVGQQSNDLQAIQGQLAQFDVVTDKEIDASVKESNDSNTLIATGMGFAQKALGLYGQIQALIPLLSNPWSGPGAAVKIAKLTQEIIAAFKDSDDKKSEGSEKSKKAEGHNKVATDIQRKQAQELIKLKQTVIVANTKMLKATIELYKEVMDTQKKNKDQLESKKRAFKNEFKQAAQMMKGKRDPKTGQLQFEGKPLPGSGRQQGPGQPLPQGPGLPLPGQGTIAMQSMPMPMPRLSTSA